MCFLTPSKCQGDEDHTGRIRERLGEGNRFCLLGVVSGGGERRVCKFSINKEWHLKVQKQNKTLPSR